MKHVKSVIVVTILGLMAGPAYAIDQTDSQGNKKSEQKQGSTGGLGLTNQPGAGGGMGEDRTPAGSPEGPRALPPGRAPGYEGADKGKSATPRVESQRDFSPPAGPPEDPVPRAGSPR